MADISYSSLQSQIQTQKGQIASQRTIISQQKISGEKGIESLRRVHPRTPPEVWFGERKPQIESIKGRLTELGQAEKELTIAETKLSEQEKLIAERKAEGWKLRSKNGEIEFYKETPVAPAVGVGAPRGDFSVMVRWRTSEGEVKTVRGLASNLASMESQIGERGGTILEVESLGGGREFREPQMRTTTGGSFLLYEAPPIVKEPVAIAKQIEVYTGLYERLPPTFKETLPTPTKFAEARGLPKEVFEEYKAAKAVEVQTKTRVMTQTEIDQLLAGKTEEEKLKWYKTNVQFGEEKKTWAEIKKDQPDWDLKVKAGKVIIATPETDREQLLKVMGAEYERLPPPARVARAGIVTVASLFRPETWIAAFLKPRPRAGMLLATTISPEAAVSVLEWEYPITKIKDPFQKWIAIQRPAYETVILPFVAGAGIGAAFKGISLATKVATGTTAKVLTQFAKKVPYVYGGVISAMVGADVGYTAAMEKAGMVKPTTTIAKISRYGVQFTFAIAGARWATAPRQPLTQKALEGQKILEHHARLRMKKPRYTLREYRPVTMKPRYTLRKYTPVAPKGARYTLRKYTPVAPKPRGPLERRYVPFGEADKIIKEPAFVRTIIFDKAGKPVVMIEPAPKQPIYKTRPPIIEPTQKYIRTLKQAIEKPPITEIIFDKAGELVKVIRGPPKPSVYKPSAKVGFKKVLIKPSIPEIIFDKAGELVSITKTIPKYIRILKPPVYGPPSGVVSEIGPVAALKTVQVLRPVLKIRPVVKIRPVLKIRPVVKAITPSVTKIQPLLYITPAVTTVGAIQKIEAIAITKQIAKLVQPQIISIPMPTIAASIAETATATMTATATIAATETATASIAATATATMTATATIAATETATASIAATETATASIAATATATLQSQIQKLIKEQITKTKYPKPSPFILPDTPYKMFGHTMGQGYNVKIKERHIVKGKKIKEPRFIRVNKRPLSLRDAESFRGMVLDNSAAASGKIVPVNAMAQEPLIKLKPFEDISHKFYMKDDILIEKREHRIDTKGEVKGISALGWYAERTKKAAKKREVVARRPRERMVRKPVDMFDFGMDDMMVNMDKIFKGVFDVGF